MAVLRRPSEDHRVSQLLHDPNTNMVTAQKDQAGQSKIDKPPQKIATWPLEPHDDRVLAFDLQRRGLDNQQQIEASPVTTSCLRCNTSMQFCGDREGAKAKGMYICNYCSRFDTELNHILPIFYTIRKQNHTKESQALDKGTPERDAIFFLTRALNKFASLCEYSDTQVLSSLLGHPSYYSSHSFWMFFVKAHVEFQKKEGCGTTHPSQSTESVTSEEPCNDLQDDDNIELLNTDDMYYDGEQVHIGRDKKVRSAKQHEHYRWRGILLEKLTPYEYCALIDVRKRSKSKKKKIKGRPPNPTFDFDQGHPLRDSHKPGAPFKVLCADDPTRIAEASQTWRADIRVPEE